MTTQDFLDRTLTEGQMSTGTQGSQRLHPNIFDDLTKAREVLLSQYYHDYEFIMKIPALPTSCFLYVHPSIREAFELRRDEVTKEDLAAMGAGLLDRVTMDYQLLHPEDAKLMNDHVKETTAKYQAERDMLLKKGVNFDPLENPLEKNPELEQIDLDLCTIDLEDNPMNQKELPTLALLKRPLYTELGQQTKEARTNARIARIVNQSSQHPGLQSATPLPADVDAPTEVTTVRAVGGVPTPKGPPQSDGEWRDQVTVSFKRAKAIDVSYRAFIMSLAKEKLGLVQGKASDVNRGDKIFTLTRNLLSLLAVPGSTDHAAGCHLRTDLTGQMWGSVCMSVGNDKPAVSGYQAISAQLIAATSAVEEAALRTVAAVAATDAYGAEWKKWWAEYGTLISKSTAVERSALLKGSIPEAAAGGNFKPGMADASSVALRHPTKRHLVPMSVKPLLPSRCNTTDETKLNVYGNDAEDLTHLIFNNTKPHHNREVKEFNEVPALSTVDGSRLYRPVTTALESDNEHCIPEAGSTSLYFSHEEEFVAGKPLLNAQCSYVLQVFDDRVEYSRVGRRVTHHHRMLQPGQNEELKKNVVVVWDDEEVADEEPPKKRQRVEA